ncbi:hypothetical protein PJP10_15440 [Mycobacterium kansasii]
MTRMRAGDAPQHVARVVAGAAVNVRSSGRPDTARCPLSCVFTG